MSVFMKKGPSFLPGLKTLWLNSIIYQESINVPIETTSRPLREPGQFKDTPSGLLSLRHRGRGLANCPIRGVADYFMPDYLVAPLG